MDNLSIIIPHYNGEKILQSCLASIYNHTEEHHEVIVVDNNSSDNSVSMIQKEFPRVTIIRNKTNLGYAGACNIGAKKAKYDYLFFLNNDTEVDKNWAPPLINKLKDDNIASVQPKIKSLINRENFDYAGASGGYIDIFGYPFCRGRVFNTIEKDILLMLLDINNQSALYYDNPKRFLNLLTSQRLLRRLDEVHLLDSSGNIIMSNILTLLFN